MGKYLMGEFEHLVLLTAIRLGADAYGVSIARALTEQTGKEVSQAATYLTLKRLEEKPPNEFARYDVIRVNRIDGWKFNLSGGHWVLIRASGTEPLIRVYVEATSDSACKRIVRDVRKKLFEK